MNILVNFNPVQLWIWLLVKLSLKDVIFAFVLKETMKINPSKDDDYNWPCYIPSKRFLHALI